MLVTRYQMHNVLECYGKKLSRGRGRESFTTGSSGKFADEIPLASDTSRLAAMDKISRQVLDKVMDVVALSDNGKLNRHSIHANESVAENAGGAAPLQFASNAMDSIGCQHACRAVAGDPDGRGGGHV
jgi:hypothetical protein